MVSTALKGAGDNDSNTIELHGQVIPVIKLSDSYAHTVNDSYSDSRVRDNIVIARFGLQLVGMAVDEFLGEYQTVNWVRLLMSLH